MTVRVEQLGYAYGRLRALRGISLVLEAPVTAIVGPNAAGKTTLLKCLAGALRPQGRVLYDGVPLSRLGRDALARMVGHLGQEPTPETTLTVLEYVLLGRLAYLGWRVRGEDLDAAMVVLQRLGAAYLAPRLLGELSGGQRQLASIAQVLAQDAALVLLDEPTNSLDLRRQLEVLEMISGLCRQGQFRGVICLHDLNLAARFADRIAVLAHGRLHAYGPPADVLTAAMLRDVYGVHAAVTLDAEGIPQVTLRRAAGPEEYPTSYARE